MSGFALLEAEELAALEQERDRLQAENTRLRAVLVRLASTEAFYVAPPEISEELRMRMDYAREALAETEGAGG